MKPTELLPILAVAEKLKCNTRHCYTSSGRHESVAEHSSRIALMAMLIAPEFPEADMDKVIRMCLIHDLGKPLREIFPPSGKPKPIQKKRMLYLTGGCRPCLLKRKRNFLPCWQR